MPEYHNSLIANINIQKILIIIRNRRSKPLTYNTMPRWPIQFIHMYFHTYTYH